jgi:N-acetylmuramoyl-L-alanine amidase
MSGKYMVRQGECVRSIAVREGFYWETLWGHPENAGLKQKRKDPTILSEGDELFIPGREEKTESCATDRRHEYRRKGLPEKLKVKLMAGEKPIADTDYILNIDGENRSGTTDGDGVLEESIPASGRRAMLWIGEDKKGIEIRLGHLDPVEEISGLQARLSNLGYFSGEVDGVMGPKTAAALRRFQKKEGLEETGEPDGKTLDALDKAHFG